MYALEICLPPARGRRGRGLNVLRGRSPPAGAGWGCSPRGRGSPACCSPLRGSWHICSTTESKGCSLCSSVHVKVCHLAPGNLPQQSSPWGGSGTLGCWPQRCLIGKRRSELSGGVGAVVEAVEKGFFAFCRPLCLIVLCCVQSMVDWGFNK